MIGKWLPSLQSLKDRAVSKLNLDSQLPSGYDRSTFALIMRAIMGQVNPLAEGRIAARYQAQASVPSSVAAAVGDVIFDSNATVRGSVAPGVAASYVRVGWICTVTSPTNATWQEMGVLTGAYGFPHSRKSIRS